MNEINIGIVFVDSCKETNKERETTTETYLSAVTLSVPILSCPSF